MWDPKVQKDETRWGAPPAEHHVQPALLCVVLNQGLGKASQKIQ